MMIRDDLQKKKSKLRDIGPKGREGSEKNQFFSLIRKRENYLGGEGLNPKVPFYLGILLVNFEYFCKSAYHQLSKIFIFLKSSLNIIYIIYFGTMS